MKIISKIQNFSKTMDKDRENYYYQIYNQKGGDFPVFQGARYIQYGNGFGDVLRGIFRHVLPVVLKGASSFIGSLSQKREQGEDWGTALRGSIMPTAGAVLNETVNRVQQSGHGKRRKGKKKRKTFSRETLYKDPRSGKKRKHFIKEKNSFKIPKYNF